MKTVTVHEWNGMRVDVWRMDAGDKIDRHKHPFSHTTGVSRGSTIVTLFFEELLENATFKMVPGSKDFIFETNEEHEIEAFEDNTIIVNMQFTGVPGKQGKDGGIATDD